MDRRKFISADWMHACLQRERRRQFALRIRAKFIALGPIRLGVVLCRHREVNLRLYKASLPTLPLAYSCPWEKQDQPIGEYARPILIELI